MYVCVVKSCVSSPVSQGNSSWQQKVLISLYTYIHACMLARICMHTYMHTYIHCVSKQMALRWLAVSLTYINRFWIIFSRNVAKWLCQKLLYEHVYFPTSPNYCFCTTWKNRNV